MTSHVRLQYKKSQTFGIVSQDIWNVVLPQWRLVGCMELEVKFLSDSIWMKQFGMAKLNIKNSRLKIKEKKKKKKKKKKKNKWN